IKYDVAVKRVLAALSCSDIKCSNSLNTNFVSFYSILSLFCASRYNRTYMEDSRVKIQPLMETVQSEATRLQEQVQPYIINMEEHMKPLTDNLNAQVKPLTDMMEKFFQQVMDQSKTLLPPQ
uniref:Antifreeze protein type IV n=1 Tax=Nothobranchius furzeri TaxID=105023 RepID=A0A8C6KRW9_NOTFU